MSATGEPPKGRRRKLGALLPVGASILSLFGLSLTSLLDVKDLLGVIAVWATTWPPTHAIVGAGLVQASLGAFWLSRALICRRMARDERLATRRPWLRSRARRSVLMFAGWMVALSLTVAVPQGAVVFGSVLLASILGAIMRFRARDERELESCTVWLANQLSSLEHQRFDAVVGLSYWVLRPRPPAGHASVASIVTSAVSALVLVAAVPAVMRPAAKTYRTVAEFIDARGHGGSRPDPDTSRDPKDGAAPDAPPTRPSAPPVEKTYEQLCGTRTRPGAPAPAPVATLLMRLWLGRGGAGARLAGCAQDARPLAHDPATWWVEGRCGSDVQSFGIASPNGSSALLLGQAARFAVGQASAGDLLGASDRYNVGVGDLHVVETRSGTHLLVRPRLTTTGGAPGPTSAPPCSSSRDQSAPYTVLPPAGTELLVSRAAVDGWAWPEPVGREAGRFRLRGGLGTPDDKIVGRLDCVGLQSCLLTDARGTRQAAGRAFSISTSAVLAVAPTER